MKDPSYTCPDKGGRLTDLHQLAAVTQVSTITSIFETAGVAYLGEKVVREKEYRSAMVATETWVEYPLVGTEILELVEVDREE